MKAIHVISAVIGGAIAGAAVGLLVAPEKGEDVREKIAKILKRKGIKISDSEVDALVAELAGEND